MKVKWKCLKCGEEFDTKPISHGRVYPTVFGVELGKDEECDGETRDYHWHCEELDLAGRQQVKN